MKNNQKSILLVALLATIISACNAGSGKVTSSQQTSGTSQESAPVKVKTNDIVNSYTDTDLKKMIGTALFNATSITGINSVSSVTAPYLTCTIQGGFFPLSGCTDGTSVNTNESGDVLVPLSTISAINNNVYQILIGGPSLSGWYSNYSLDNENYNMDYNLNPTGQDLSNYSSFVMINNDMESSFSPLYAGGNTYNNPSDLTQTLTTSVYSQTVTNSYTTSTTTSWNFTFGEKSSLKVPILIGEATGEVSWSIGVNTSSSDTSSTSISQTYSISPQNVLIPPHSNAQVAVYFNVASVSGTYTTYTRVPDIIQFNSISSPDSSASHSLYVSLPAAFQSDPTDFSFLSTVSESAGLYVKGSGNYTSQNGTDFIVNVTITPESASSASAKSLNALTGNSNKKTYSYHVKAIPVPTN